MKKPFRSIMKKASSLTDIPADTLLNEPTIVFYGYREVAIDRHVCILEYSNEKIVVLLQNGIVSITGTDLQLKQMIKERMTVIGGIHALEIGEQ